MKKLAFICISLIPLLIVMSFFNSYNIVLAKTSFEKPFDRSSYHPYDSLDKNTKAQVDSPILLPFSSSGLSTDLTSSFSGIINMQIYTGLNR
jgi:hypothetical protein